jgi:hypothetical protein
MDLVFPIMTWQELFFNKLYPHHPESGAGTDLAQHLCRQVHGKGRL